MADIDWAAIELPRGDDFGYPSDDDDLHEDFTVDASFGNVIGKKRKDKQSQKRKRRQQTMRAQAQQAPFSVCLFLLLI